MRWERWKRDRDLLSFFFATFPIAFSPFSNRLFPPFQSHFTPFSNCLFSPFPIAFITFPYHLFTPFPIPFPPFPISLFPRHRREIETYCPSSLQLQTLQMPDVNYRRKDTDRHCQMIFIINFMTASFCFCVSAKCQMSVVEPRNSSFIMQVLATRVLAGNKLNSRGQGTVVTVIFVNKIINPLAPMAV